MTPTSDVHGQMELQCQLQKLHRLDRLEYLDNNLIVRPKIDLYLIFCI